MLKLLDMEKIKAGIQYGIGVSLGFMLVAFTSELLLGLVKIIVAVVAAKSGMGVNRLQ